ncbi:alpha/beta fold hydrolase [Yunchengibacter salinarum]|uniref:alpha/beta fold hydrolase n=1 Tax=Yunchengibacter salinarum TaxID=3133399 RepID=UPI0035B69589
MLAGLPQGGASAQDQGRPAAKPCYLDGLKDAVDCYRFDLPLHHAGPGAETVSVFAAVLPARSARPQPDPLVILAGGPGQAASELAPLVDRIFDAVRDSRDIVLIDQRGTGRSTPLQCDLETDVNSLSALTDAVRACRAGFDLDVAAFTQENAVQDFRAVLDRLGYGSVNLWGGSYGTRVISHYVKRFPDHVRAFIADSIAPPDRKLFRFAPKAAGRAMDRLLADCAAFEPCRDRYPDLGDRLDRLMDRAAAGELAFSGPDPMTRDVDTQPLPLFLVANGLRGALYQMEGTATLPYVIARAAEGDLTPLAGLFSEGRVLPHQPLYFGATLSVLCGDELDRITAEEARAAGRDSFTRGSFYEFWAAACAGWDYTPFSRLPADQAEPLESDLPALLLSGDLDPITPPDMGAHLLGGLENGAHKVVPGTGHIASTVPCVGDAIVRFLAEPDARAAFDGGDDDSPDCAGTRARLKPFLGPNGRTVPAPEPPEASDKAVLIGMEARP